MTTAPLEARAARPVAAAAAVALSLSLSLSACAVGPDYRKPSTPVAPVYKELAGWKAAEPQDAAPRGPWWSVFGDPVLDRLVRQVDISNQTLKASEASFRQARALVAEARSGLFPTLSASASARRTGSGGGGGSGSRSGGTSTAATATGGTGSTVILSQTGGGGTYRNQFSTSLGATWDLDVWGRIRRTIESDVASAQASAADLASARLSLQSELAIDYFELRARDEQQRLLDDAVRAYTQSFQITRNQYNAGLAAKADVVTAETQLETTRAQAINVGVQRAQLEHAIAVLTGQPPAQFSLPPGRLALVVPVAPTGLPSALLERRPDIAAAERQVAAANAQIGVAIAGYFPDVTLSGSYGFQSSVIDKLFRAANSFWSVGPDAAVSLFDGGLTNAQVEAAHAAYDQTVANYRQVTLTGFQQIEDQLATLRILEQQAEVQARAVALAREAERLQLNQYRAGTVPYTSVITAQQTALSNEETALSVLESRLVASVSLVEALGGGWDASQLPNAADLNRGNIVPFAHVDEAFGRRPEPSETAPSRPGE